MARATPISPKALIDELNISARELDQYAEEALHAAADVVEPAMRANLTAALKDGRGDTGQLLSALGVTPVGVDRAGNHDLKVGFAENRRDGGVNAKIANILEYGTSRIRPRRFQSTTRRQTKTAAESAMKQVFEQRLSKG